MTCTCSAPDEFYDANCPEHRDEAGPQTYYTINEQVTYEIAAESAQDALDKYLAMEDTVPVFTGVLARYVTDEDGEEIEVVDQ